MCVRVRYNRARVRFMTLEIEVILLCSFNCLVKGGKVPSLGKRMLQGFIRAEDTVDAAGVLMVLHPVTMAAFLRAVVDHEASLTEMRRFPCVVDLGCRDPHASAEKDFVA